MSEPESFSQKHTQRKNFQVQPKPSCRLWFATKSSPGHQRVEVHRNTPQKRAQQVKKTPWFTQIRFTDYGLRRNHLLGNNVSRYTERVPENVLSGSKNPQVQSKPSYKLWFATKSSSRHKRVEGQRNTPKNVLRRSENPQVQSKPSYKL